MPGGQTPGLPGQGTATSVQCACGKMYQDATLEFPETTDVASQVSCQAAACRLSRAMPGSPSQTWDEG